MAAVHFTACWDAHNRDLKTRSTLNAVLRSLYYSIFGPLIFIGSSFCFKDPKKVGQANRLFQKFGGVELKLKAADGGVTRSIEFKAEQFRQKMETYLDYRNGYWSLKESLYEMRDGKLRCQEGEAKEFLCQLIDLKTPFEKVENETKCELRFPGENWKKSRGQVIFSHGRGAGAAAFKSVASYYLMRGYDVIMVDHRGFGQSPGSSTDRSCKLDLDAAYQYVQSQGVPNEKIIAHGYCIGTAFVADLAARRAKVHVVLDRPFVEARRACRGVPWAQSIANIAPKSIVDLDNRETLKKVTGRVVVIWSKYDEVIDEEETMLLLDSDLLARAKSVSFIPTFNEGHQRMWFKEKQTTDAFNQQLTLF